MRQTVQTRIGTGQRVQLARQQRQHGVQRKISVSHVMRQIMQSRIGTGQRVQLARQQRQHGVQHKINV